MQVRIEKIGENEPEEVVIYCRKITSEINAITRHLTEIEKNRMVPAFFKREEQYYLSLADILFFETDDERVFAHTAADSFETRMRLYELEAILPGNFVRVSRSSIINLLHVLSIKKGLSRVNLVSFRQSHKVVYCSRMYNSILIKKMKERSLNENA